MNLVKRGDFFFAFELYGWALNDEKKKLNEI